MKDLTNATLNNSFKSFKLKRGYMVTFALGKSGWGYSRCVIADQEDLEMVDGADTFLDYLTEDGMYVTVYVSLEETEDNPIKLRLVAHDEIGGTYQVENLEGFKQDVWLCNVVHFLYGEHPENFYFRQL